MAQLIYSKTLRKVTTLIVFFTLLICGAWFKSATAAESNYPNQAVKIVVPYSAGGFTDIMARSLAKLLTKKWDNPVVVENVAGAGGNLGAGKVARAKPDGYTLLVSNTATNSINQYIYDDIGFDPIDGFDPVILIIKTPNAVIVNQDLPVDSVKDLVKLLKDNPNKYNYGSSGIGTTAQLTGALFQDAAKVQIAHIPYKGSSEAMTALQGGFVQMAFDNSVAWAPLIQAGKAKALAVASAKHSSLLPNVPTLEEEGFKDFESSSWFGISAPEGISQTIIGKINKDINQVI